MSSARSLVVISKPHTEALSRDFMDRLPPSFVPSQSAFSGSSRVDSLVS